MRGSHVIVFVLAVVVYSITLVTASAPLVNGVNILYAPSTSVASSSSFDHSYQPHNSSNLAIDFHWSIVTNTAGETNLLHALVTFTYPSSEYKGNGWISIGFGSSMVELEAPICFQNGTSSPMFIQEYFAIKKRYEAAFTSTTAAVTFVAGQSTDSSISCEFTRPLAPMDGHHKNIGTTDGTHMMWAYSLGNAASNDGAIASIHETNARGQFSINLGTGELGNVRKVRFRILLAHGLLALCAAFVVLPILIVSNDAFESRSWYRSSGVLAFFRIPWVAFCIFLPLVVALAATQRHARTNHMIVSILCIISYVIFQVSSDLSYHFDGNVRKSLLINKFVWFVLFMCFMIAASALGLTAMFPWKVYQHYSTVKAAGLGSWIIFIIFCCTVAPLIIAHQYLSLVRKLSSSSTSESDTKSKAVNDIAKGSLATIASNKSKDTLAYNSKATSKHAITETAMTLYKDEDKKEVHNFTWEALDEAVRNGGKFVVANGKYVFSTSRFITQHPGGQLILHVVNGTDITNDYFHEAGFDADDIVPRLELPETLTKAVPQTSTHTLNKPSTATQERQRSADQLVSDNKYVSTLSEGDWKMIIKSRKPHVHSKAAIDKLSSLFIGTLSAPAYKGPCSPPAESLLPSGYTDANFSPHEYRRYALLSSSEVETGILEMRFSLLYPHDRRLREPIHFLPGQMIQFQARINNQDVCGYYYPILDGNLQHFKILVNVSEGIANGYLMQQNLGQRQHKFRGPFGTPLFKIPKDPYDRPTFPRDIVIFSSGLGILCADQILRHVFIPSFEPITAIEEYATEMEDELSISTGDRLIVLHHYYDGWAFAYNLRTGLEGLIPLTVFPVLNPTKVTIVHIGTGFNLIEKTISGINVLQDENITIETVCLDKVAQVSEMLKQRCVQLLGSDGTFVKLLTQSDIDSLSEDELYKKLQVVLSSDNMVDELSILNYMREFGVLIPSTSPSGSSPEQSEDVTGKGARGKVQGSTIQEEPEPEAQGNSRNVDVVTSCTFRSRTGMIQKYDILRWYH